MMSSLSISNHLFLQARCATRGIEQRAILLHTVLLTALFWNGYSK
jgi:hypothetical protein